MDRTVNPVLALDVGGTKLAAALVDRTGTVLRRDQTPTPAGADAETTWRALADLCDRVAAGTAPGGVGVGCVGPMTWPAGEVSPLNVGGWRGFPLRARLADRFAGVPVRVHNDGVATAVGEHWRGTGRDRANMLGMVISTGVGGGLVLGDRLVDGGTGNAGHVGHVVVEPDGPPCACGGHGCLEAVAAGPAVTRWALAHGWRPPGGVGPTAREVAAAAGSGDPVARAAFDRAGELAGQGIASVVTLLDLDVVVVGGGLAQAGPLLFAPLLRGFRRHARMAFARRTPVLPAALGADAGLVGAAALVWRADRYWSGD